MQNIYNFVMGEHENTINGQFFTLSKCKTYVQWDVYISGAFFSQNRILDSALIIRKAGLFFSNGNYVDS